MIAIIRALTYYGAIVVAVEAEPPEKTATQRVLTDDTLRPGDIVSTDKGLFLYRGKSGTDGQVTDFVAIPPR